jgi:CDP-diacylglycerol---glycerol-3-phosphate 3-phosphatidyltransferase
MERPERMVLMMIGTVFDHMAPVLWILAVMGNFTVIHRMMYTYQQAKQLEDAQLRSVRNMPDPDTARTR